jgi:hypothetical protein
LAALVLPMAYAVADVGIPFSWGCYEDRFATTRFCVPA